MPRLPSGNKGGLVRPVQDQRSSRCLVCSAPWPFPGRSENSVRIWFSTCDVSSVNMLFLFPRPMPVVWQQTGEPALPAAASRASSSCRCRCFTAARQRLGGTKRCFCWAPRLESQEGPQGNALLKWHTQEPTDGLAKAFSRFGK